MNPRLEWELPGGRLEIGETPQECLVREVLEECDLKIIPKRPLNPCVFEVVPRRFVLLVPYLCAVVSNSAVIRLSIEHVQMGFFPKNELLNIPLPAEYVSIISEVIY